MASKRSTFRIGLAVVIGALVVRAAVLYSNTYALVQTSDTFPTKYTVGTDKSLPEINYVVLGDSTVQGAGVAKVNETLPYLIANQIADRGFRVNVTNLGVVGATSADVATDQIPKLRELDPNLITVNVGSNDATHFIDYAEFSRYMLQILSASSKTPKTLVVIASTPDLSLVPAMQPGLSGIVGWRAEQQNKVLANLTTGSQAKIIDLFNNGKLAGSDNYASDDFHPSARGYAKWAELYSSVTESIRPGSLK